MPITDATPPPAKGMGNVSSRTVSRKTSNLTQEREECVAQLGMFAQVPLIATRQFADAGAIGVYWPSIAHELAVLAETQEPIARVIDPLMTVGPYAGLIAAALPMVMQFAVNHGRIKPGSMRTVPASVLQAQVETSMAQTELHALRMQQEAEEQAARARAEIQQSRDAVAKAEREANRIPESADAPTG